ncbi:uncharacterized protein LOC122672347 [Telopea speciosissima]|uniref:uncharacterized protein LOC122672347 n=1 Tax=Telopea speciosissima TaxID=54955 RepID=UPI001CC36A76|nr:uncharacterized protein LOC122672347 [Telopea speciosissima]
MAAFMVGVNMACELGVDKIWIESDSAALVTTVLSRKVPWYFLQRWWSAMAFLDSIQWRITHCYREANAAADALANNAAKQKSLGFWDNPPPFIAAAVSNDAHGRPYCRFP